MQLDYQHLPARSGKTLSAVVLLHGFGATARSILSLGEALAEALPDTAFYAPEAPDAVPGKETGRMWYSIPELDGSSVEEADARLLASAEKLDAFLDQLMTETGLPPSAVALAGFSQGAGLSYQVGPRRREALAGIVAIAGRMKRKDTLAAEVRSTPPVLILTGATDNLLAASETTAAKEALEPVGCNTQHVVMNGTGHGISEDGHSATSDLLKRAFETAT